LYDDAYAKLMQHAKLRHKILERIQAILIMLQNIKKAVEINWLNGAKD